MAAQQPDSLVLASPFKFGFFAGLGFFFASALMSVMTVVLFGMVGIGTVLAAIAGTSHVQSTQQQTAAPDAQPASAELTPSVQSPAVAARPTYHRKTRAYGDN